MNAMRATMLPLKLHDLSFGNVFAVSGDDRLSGSGSVQGTPKLTLHVNKAFDN